MSITSRTGVVCALAFSIAPGCKTATSHTATSSPPAPVASAAAATVAATGRDFVWIDDDFVWDEQHGFDPAPRALPDNWFEPIDYFHGQIRFKVDVHSKADDTPVWLEVCMWQEKLGGPHVCLNYLRPPWATAGTRECQMSVSDLKNPPVDFHKPFVATQIRIKDGSTGRGKDLAKLGKGLPIRAHYSVVLGAAPMPTSSISNDSAASAGIAGGEPSSP